MPKEKAPGEGAYTEHSSVPISIHQEKHILACIRLGFHIFPNHTIIDGRCTCGNPNCKHPGKHPRCPSGYKDATNDFELLRTLSKGKPFNLAVATGKQSGVVVVDIDPRHNGHRSWGALGAKYGVPNTWAVSTGSGGTHLYFRWSDEMPIGQLEGNGPLVGIDVRGERSSATLPPSRGLQQEYRWLVTPKDIPPSELPVLPTWFYELAKKQMTSPNAMEDIREYRKRRSQQIQELREIAAGVSEGRRNGSATRLTGYLLSHIDPVVAEYLLRAWDTFNSPPLGDELDSIIESICRRELSARRRA